MESHRNRCRTAEPPSRPGSDAADIVRLSHRKSNVISISASGVLTFRSPPDYESPHDSNERNVYKVTVRASDGSLADSRNVTVTVTNRPPTIDSGLSSVDYAEGGTGSVGSYSASDPCGGPITWLLTSTSTYATCIQLFTLPPRMKSVSFSSVSLILSNGVTISSNT